MMAVNIFIVQKSDYNNFLSSLAAQPINYEFWRQQQKPKDLVFGNMNILESSDGRKDLVVLVKNENDNFLVRRIVYKFLAGGQTIAENETHIWPGQEKPLVAFGVDGASVGAGVSLQILETDWQRVKNTFQFLADLQARQRFLISEKEFISARRGTGGSAINSRVTFNVTNESIFDYWNTGFYILLYSGSGISGAHYIEVEKFLSGETKSLEVVWANPIYSVSRIEIIPEINVLDDAVYVKAGLEAGEPK